ncbi:SRPBCC family protein [Shewanella sp. OMA3-2]|uniref:SRPBCC family protein n=1 Tax=Shewanella sp. OMA3-2 TaxID=2908650 RepID=UPI001F2ACF4F|nr:SRPBCC family protein [Shewanella sp. OMA3-2]UJF20865.1 SRPBCC family protein [Shewanella sp. OMA3-2]
MKISIETIINAPLNLVWLSWVNPDEIKNWHFASSDWCCPFAQIDLVVGGKFNYRMEAKDGSMGFDFEGEFTAIAPLTHIRYTLEDNREVDIQFSEYQGQTTIAETFEAEDENSVEQQRQGWLMILENFKQYVEYKK